mmetsp:Transcript_80148/g.224307  ORF Transcript_80148/g.224307 Transcript_80148/m.224307 type:complete len:123 (+) Transcript_80148:132-500(+)
MHWLVLERFACPGPAVRAGRPGEGGALLPAAAPTYLRLLAGGRMAGSLVQSLGKPIAASLKVCLTVAPRGSTPLAKASQKATPVPKSAKARSVGALARAWWRRGVPRNFMLKRPVFRAVLFL